MGYSRRKVEKRQGKFGKIGLNNWSISKSKKGDETQVSGRKVKVEVIWKFAINSFAANFLTNLFSQSHIFLNRWGHHAI